VDRHPAWQYTRRHAARDCGEEVIVMLEWANIPPLREQKSDPLTLFRRRAYVERV